MTFDEFLRMGINLVKDRAKNHLVQNSEEVPIHDRDDVDHLYD